MEHTINGRTIDCNIACTKEEAPSSIKEMKKKKIFVGGLSLKCTQGNFFNKQF